jgi:hypothetical protein
MEINCVRKIRERDIESYLRIRAKAMGGEVRKVEWVGRRGAPDRLLMVKARPLSKSLDCAWCKPVGRAVWIELKAPGEKPEAHQLREHIRMREMGQDVRVIDSFELVEAVISELFI